MSASGILFSSEVSSGEGETVRFDDHQFVPGAVFQLHCCLAGYFSRHLGFLVASDSDSPCRLQEDTSFSSAGIFSTIDAVEMVKMPWVLTRTLTFTRDFSPSFCAETF